MIPEENKTNGETQRSQLLAGSKGVIIAVIIGIIAVVIGVSALIGFKSSNQYQGYLKKIEQQTENLTKP